MTSTVELPRSSTTTRAIRTGGRSLDIGVDLDGVGYDLCAQLREWRHRRHGVALETMPDPETWDFHTAQWGMAPGEFLGQLSDGVRDGFLFRYGSPMPGFLAGMRVLTRRGHRVHIITARELPGLEDEARAYTQEWLATWDVPHHTLILTAEKEAIHTDLIIEDSAGNYDRLEAAGRRPYLLDQPWNAGHPGRRVADWAEFVYLVDQVAWAEEGMPASL